MALLRQLHFTGTLDYIPNQQGLLETKWLTGELQTVFESGDSITLRYVDTYEFLEQGFRLRPDITINPVSGPGGTIATLAGEGFKSFTTLTALTVGGTTVEPKPSGPCVNKDGILEASEVLIPGLDPGTHTVKATVGGTVVSVGFTVTADAVVATAADLSGEQTTADAFASIIDNDDNLVGVFSFDNATQTWTSYDPDPDFADFNDLDTVSGGNIVWVRVLKAQDFDGQALVDGWNQIVLP